MTDEWTTADEQRLASLPRERQPGRLLEERTVAALRDEGLLVQRRGGAPGGGWWAAGVAAALACFLGGFTFGQVLGTRQTVDLVTQVRAADAQQMAAAVQQAGSAYIAALVGLGMAAESADPGAVAAGREVALNAFWAAADEVARIAPDDPLVGLMLQAQERAARPPGEASPPRHVVWF